MFITVIIVVIIIIVVIVSVKGEPLRRIDAHLPGRIRAAAAARVRTATAACIRATAVDTTNRGVRPAVAPLRRTGARAGAFSPAATRDGGRRRMGEWSVSSSRERAGLEGEWGKTVCAAREGTTGRGETGGGDLIPTPGAAQVPEPGRGIWKVGTDLI